MIPVVEESATVLRLGTYTGSSGLNVVVRHRLLHGVAQESEAALSSREGLFTMGITRHHEEGVIVETRHE